MSAFSSFPFVYFKQKKPLQCVPLCYRIPIDNETNPNVSCAFAQTDIFEVELVAPRGIALVESGVYDVAESDRNCVTKVSRDAVLRRQNGLPHCNDVACHGASVAVWPSHGLAMVSMTPTVLVGELRSCVRLPLLLTTVVWFSTCTRKPSTSIVISGCLSTIKSTNTDFKSARNFIMIF